MSLKESFGIGSEWNKGIFVLFWVSSAQSLQLNTRAIKWRANATVLYGQLRSKDTATCTMLKFPEITTSSCQFAVLAESENSSMSFHMYCVLFVVKNMWIETNDWLCVFWRVHMLLNLCWSPDWWFYYVFYSKYHLFEGLNPRMLFKTINPQCTLGCV